MSRPEQLNEQTAASYNAFVLITSKSIRLFAQHTTSHGTYFYRDVRHADALDGGITRSFYILPELAYSYRSIRLYVDFGSKYILVPDDFLGQGLDPVEWLSADALEGHHPLSVNVADQRCSILYTLPDEVYEFCNRSFVVRQFEHPLEPAIEAAVRRSRTREGIVMTALVRDVEGYVDVIMVHRGQIMLSNRYAFSNEVDILYYLTSLWRQSEMMNPRDHLYIYGASGDTVTSKLSRLMEEAIDHLHLNDYGDLIADRSNLSDILKSDPELPESFIFILTA